VPARTASSAVARSVVQAVMMNAAVQGIAAATSVSSASRIILSPRTTIVTAAPKSSAHPRTR
jgi:hypothetical protein